MTITITRTPGGATTSPFMALGYRWRRPSPNIVHPLIGAAEPEFTVGPLHTREGTLTFLCRTGTEALALESFHLPAGTFALVDTAQSMGNIAYALAEGGSIGLDQTDDRKYWIVTIDVKGLS